MNVLLLVDTFRLRIVSLSDAEDVRFQPNGAFRLKQSRLKKLVIFNPMFFTSPERVLDRLLHPHRIPVRDIISWIFLLELNVKMIITKMMLITDTLGLPARDDDMI